MAKGGAVGGAVCTAISGGRKEPITNMRRVPYSEIPLGVRWKMYPTGKTS